MVLPEVIFIHIFLFVFVSFSNWINTQATKFLVLDLLPVITTPSKRYLERVSAIISTECLIAVDSISMKISIAYLYTFGLSLTTAITVFSTVRKKTKNTKVFPNPLTPQTPEADAVKNISENLQERITVHRMFITFFLIILYLSIEEWVRYFQSTIIPSVLTAWNQRYRSIRHITTPRAFFREPMEFLHRVSSSNFFYSPFRSFADYQKYVRICFIHARIWFLPIREGAIHISLVVMQTLSQKG